MTPISERIAASPVSPERLKELIALFADAVGPAPYNPERTSWNQLLTLSALRELEQARLDLVEARKYMKHDSECSVHLGRHAQCSCNCGLEALRERIKP